MSFSSFPSYPPPPTATRAEPTRLAGWLSPQLARILKKLAMAVAIVIALCWLRFAADRLNRPSAPAPAPTLQEFRFVEDWYDSVGLFMTREQVEELFGPPTELSVRSPELTRKLTEVEHSNRHFGLPTDRVWVRWNDPDDPRKSVTILFASGKVYYKSRTGFDSLIEDR